MPAIVLAVAASAAIPASAEPEIPPARTGLVVHEWGTFTTVAGDDGIALDWRPLAGESDLPDFVYSTAKAVSDATGPGLRHGARCQYADAEGRCKCKGCVVGSVRMETPVLYFYAPKEMTVDVSVRFPGGQITEWYPHARTVSSDDKGKSGLINWGTVKVMPGKKVELPTRKIDSHYWPARETDADPVSVCSKWSERQEYEKFLFYRGVGSFGVPLKVTQADGALHISSSAGPVTAVAFRRENEEDAIQYAVLSNVGAEPVKAEFKQAARRQADVEGDLVRMLTKEGLYEKEATAMVKTWQTDWFEPGTRVFYLVPTAETEKLLPLKLDPAPQELVRVMVGRVEVITPEMESEVRGFLAQALASSVASRAAGEAGLKAYGRFLEPILKRLLTLETDRFTRNMIRLRLGMGPEGGC